MSCQLFVTLYICISLCTQTAETTSPEPFSWISLHNKIVFDRDNNNTNFINAINYYFYFSPLFGHFYQKSKPNKMKIYVCDVKQFIYIFSNAHLLDLSLNYKKTKYSYQWNENLLIFRCFWYKSVKLPTFHIRTWTLSKHRAMWVHFCMIASNVKTESLFSFISLWVNIVKSVYRFGAFVDWISNLYTWFYYTNFKKFYFRIIIF